MARARIGVSGPDRGGLAMWFFTALAVWRAGGRPVRLTPKRAWQNAAFDGLILCGGADVGELPESDEIADAVETVRRESRPWRRRWLGVVIYGLVYGLRRVLGLKAYGGKDARRDAMEHALVADALQNGKPVLGICRGAQLLNVHLGGTLHRDLSDFYIESPQIRTVLPRKLIEPAKDSRLAAILGGAPTRVNALHRQAVDSLGGGLRVSAVEESGVVQAIEHTDMPFVVGVQWHPEFLPHIATQQGLFRALIESAARL